MINTKRPGTDDYTQVGFIEAKDNQGNYQNIDHIYDSEGNIVFQQGYLNEYDGADDFSIPAIGKPLIDYTIYGNTFQDGIPTPDNPIMPEGTGERTGNLFSGEFSQFDNVGGTGNIYSYFYMPEDFTLTLIAKDTHTIPDNIFLGITKDGGQSTGGFTWAIPQRKAVIGGDIFTVKSSTSGYHYVSMYRKIEAALSWVLEHYYVMLNLGSTPLPYEPYGIKIPISSASTTTPVYLGEVQTTRKIKKLVLTGEEKWRLNNRLASVGGQYFNVSITTQERTEFGRMLCSHYPVANPYDRLTACCALANYTQGIDVRVNNPSTDGNIDTFKAYLAQQYAAGTPVTVWYVLATEETGIVNEPLMRIGNYVDSIDSSQAGVQIPTLKRPNTTVIDITTSLPPSEVYAKYRGSKTQ